MNKNCDIIIFGGQSNMQGQSDCLSDTSIVDNAYEYKFFGDIFVPLKNPVGENVTYDMTEGDQVVLGIDEGLWVKNHVLGAACYGNTNMVPAFCNAYISRTNTNVIAIHTAKGSTEVADWLPGTAGYDALIKKAASGIKKASESFKINQILFVWLQGESDAIASVSKSDYKKKLTILNDSLKKELKLDKFGVIRVGRFTNDSRDDEIILAQDEICEENSDFIMLTKIATELNQIPEYMHPRIGGHYSAKGLEKLGKTAGEALGEYVINLE